MGGWADAWCQMASTLRPRSQVPNKILHCSVIYFSCRWFNGVADGYTVCGYTRYKCISISTLLLSLQLYCGQRLCSRVKPLELFFRSLIKLMLFFHLAKPKFCIDISEHIYLITKLVGCLATLQVLAYIMNDFRFPGPRKQRLPL